MINHSDIQGSQPSQRRLNLPAYPVENHSVHTNPNVKVPPEMLIRRKTPPPPQNPLARLHYFWRQDPAYKVLILAIGIVLISGFFFTTVVTGKLVQGSNFFSQGSASLPNAPATVLPTGTVDHHPAFPTPGGGDGSTASSQPPQQSTPVLQATSPTAAISPTPAGSLTVDITSIPSRVKNNSTVPVGVTTNQAGVTVNLIISYSGLYDGSAGPGTTDGNGNVTIPWQVTAFPMGNRFATATVVAVGQDQDGHQAQSQPVTVRIAGGGG